MRRNATDVRRLMLSALFCIVLLACGNPATSESPTDSNLATTSASIANQYWDFNGLNNESTGVGTPHGAAATACRIYTGVNCTCVLVARNVVMTAAHCTRGRDATQFKVAFPRLVTDPWPGIPTWSGYNTPDAQFKWVGDAAGNPFEGSWKYERPAYSSDCAGDDDCPEGSDIALVFLTSSVPPDVVNLPAPLRQGNVGKAISNRYTPDPVNLPSAIAVGRGGGHPMRIGPMKKIWSKWDTCEFLEGKSFCPNTCQERAQIRAANGGSDRPEMESGDSGGPLFLYNHNTERYEVIGVHSGWENCPDPNVAVWAHVGKLRGDDDGGISTHVRAAIGNDPDGDFFNDDVDVCPDVFDPNQADDDADTVGDACDNCRENLECAGNTWAECSNVSQADRDNDGIGDLCDFCPELPSRIDYLGAQRDSDGDGVGDECDGAPGVYRPNLTCTDDAYCAANHAGFCVKEPHQEQGRCSRQIDQDGDDVEDSVDLCVGWADPENRNSNWLAETLRGVPPKGDVCEEVPIYRLLPQWDDAIASSNAVDANPQYWVDRVPLGGQPVYGDGGATKDIVADVVFRYCSCYSMPGDRASWGSDLACAIGAGCDTDFAEAARQPWKEISLEDAETQTPLSPPDTLGSQIFSPGGVGEVDVLAWNWRDDISAGAVDAREDILNDPLPYIAVFSDGLIGSVVTGRGYRTVLGDWVGNAETDRDRSAQLRVSTQRYRNQTRPPDVRQPVFGEADWLECIQNPGCILSVWDGVYAVINPGEWLRVPRSLFFDAGTGDLARIDRLGGFVGVPASAALIQAVAAGNIYWSPAVESPSVLERNGISSQAVGLALDVEREPLVVIAENQMYRLAEENVGLLAASTPPRATVQLDPGVRALFSALENRIYILGSESEFRAFIDVYDIEKGIWDTPDWAPDHSPDRALLAATYDSIGKLLYTLQVDDGSAYEVVRLVRHDFRARTSQVLWEAPWAGGLERYAMVLQPDRRPVVIRSESGSYSACVFDGTSFIGVRSGLGELVGLPVTAEVGVAFVAYREGEHARAEFVLQGERDPSVYCF